ncbi:beta-phosphoglucomutase family hydrolase [Amycolatopsis taiwanensis]|uniref:Beta-phosphoglucomutase n=1 Tax=Amycolatopsis taiwanensis TaxID=342230 RepID=A0A9W6R5M8_9PSEU|nr:beta-phosphoglucomutase family hydrolase [Amycolatopsis taiwanensis]GLY69436.1 hydrolase [Amycolatopsis taiwanensis]
MIGLPDDISACLFDLDGVLTGTAELHKQAWKQTFDSFLRERDGSNYRCFTDRDYAEYVDGRPRLDGVRGFLASRNISLPEGGPGDKVTDHSVHGLAARKNELVLRIIEHRGVDPYPGSVRYLEAVQRAGLRIAVVTSSANAASVLEAANLDRFAQARIDGVVIEREKLRGKPAPDSFLAAAKALGVAPANAAVFEDALAGVAAGKAGGFGHVVGVDREDQADELRAHGADVVVRDLSELLRGDA